MKETCSDSGIFIPDAILVPGGGVTEQGQPSPWVVPRLERAAKIQEEVRSLTGAAARIITLSAGTTYKAPPVDGAGFPVFEANAGAQYLVEKCGVDPDAILTEPWSYDTNGNAAMTRFMHLDPNPDFARLSVVTSKFHMPRTRAIFEWICGIAPNPQSGKEYELAFEEVLDVGMDEEALAARVAKEQKGLDSLRQNVIGRVTTLPELHHWLFVEHGAYSSMRPAFATAASSIGAAAAKSY